MTDIQNIMKSHARILHKAVKANNPKAMQRIRRGHGLALDKNFITNLQRRHCLTVVAREMGFKDWPHAKTVLDGQSMGDFGTCLYPPRCGAHSNVWLATYDEAKRIHAKNGGYLLVYKGNFFLADRGFITTLGLNPDDPLWSKIGHDWAKPTNIDARNALYSKLAHTNLESID